MKTLDAEDRAELEKLLAQATEERLALDQTLGSIEAIVGTDLDHLDEWVGNGISADDLLEGIEDEDDE